MDIGEEAAETQFGQDLVHLVHISMGGNMDKDLLVRDSFQEGPEHLDSFLTPHHMFQQIGTVPEWLGHLFWLLSIHPTTLGFVQYTTYDCPRVHLFEHFEGVGVHLHWWNGGKELFPHDPPRSLAFPNVVTTNGTIEIKDEMLHDPVDPFICDRDTSLF